MRLITKQIKNAKEIDVYDYGHKAVEYFDGRKNKHKALKGLFGVHNILSIYREGDNDNKLVFNFHDGSLILFDNGQSCCENRYMTIEDDLQYYVGAKLYDIWVDGYRDENEDEEYGAVYELQFVKIRTSRGDFTICNHNEHNGYYGGFNLEISYKKNNKKEEQGE